MLVSCALRLWRAYWSIVDDVARVTFAQSRAACRKAAVPEPFHDRMLAQPDGRVDRRVL